MDEIARFEGRSNKLDLQRIALEGDIQRLQMTLQEKENSLRNYHERLENQQRSSGQIEDRYFWMSCFNSYNLFSFLK